jgi:hypothetical protein
MPELRSLAVLSNHCSEVPDESSRSCTCSQALYRSNQSRNLFLKLRGLVPLAPSNEDLPGVFCPCSCRERICPWDRPQSHRSLGYRHTWALFLRASGQGLPRRPHQWILILCVALRLKSLQGTSHHRLIWCFLVGQVCAVSLGVASHKYAAQWPKVRVWDWLRLRLGKRERQVTEDERGESWQTTRAPEISKGEMEAPFSSEEACQ